MLMEKKQADLADIYGRYGLWQKKLFAFSFITSMLSAWHNLVMAFLAPNQEYWCARPDDVFQNGTTLKDWLKTGVPWAVDEGGHSHPSRCRMYDLKQPSADHNWTTVECDEWEFDQQVYQATIIDQWNLVCQQEWLISFTQSMYMAGYMTSMLIFGQLSDRFGRRPVVLTAVGIFIVSGFACLQTSEFLIFTVMRFFISLGVSGAGATSFVILMEMVGAEYRSNLGLGFNYGWAVGFVLLPALAWLVPHWYYLQLSITAPSICLLLAYWLVPESPRWLMTNRKFDQAEDLVTRAAAVNGRDITDAMRLFKQYKENGNKIGEQTRTNATVLDLLRTPNMRKKTLNIFFCWFVNSFIYFGLSLNTNDLGGDPFLNFFISGAIEFPAYAAAAFAIRKLGRRMPQTSVMVVGGIACLLTIPIPGDLLWLRITLAMIGKFCITASFGMIYVFSAEIFPTVVRNMGIGWSSTCARIGSIIAPFVKELGRATHPAVPFTVYGGLSLISAFLVHFLPETLGCQLPDTVEEGENFGIKTNIESLDVEDELKSFCNGPTNDNIKTTYFNHQKIEENSANT